MHRGESEPVMAETWAPGETIVGQSVWGGKVRVACPMFVIYDRPDVLATYIPRGTIFKQARTLEGGIVRLPLGEWVLVDEAWTVAAVMLAFPGQRYRLLGFWDAPHERIIMWYANLETPLERSRHGFTFTDLFLDVVISGDLRAWRWKDEDELNEAVQAGLLTHDQARDVYEAGDHVIELVQMQGSPFSDGWEQWKPHPSWRIPVL
jgi:predicted RNA-binding protein associated with RNAse of E/G family